MSFLRLAIPNLTFSPLSTGIDIHLAPIVERPTATLLCWLCFFHLTSGCTNLSGNIFSRDVTFSQE
jgi:hypothetical protein